MIQGEVGAQDFFRVSSRALDVLEWAALQDLLEARARTPGGAQLCKHLRPGSLSQNQAQTRAQAALDLVALKIESNLILPLVDGPELGNMFLRISRSGAISLEEFNALARFHKVSQGLHHFLLRYAPKKTALLSTLHGIELLEAWSRKYFPLLDAQGQIVDSASEDLRALRASTKDLHQKIRTRLEDFLHSPKLAEIMQDFYVTVRDGRYVIPVKTNFRSRVPGIVHDVSNTEATLFVEPQEIVEWNNQLKVAEKEIEKEIERILAEVVEGTKPFVSALARNAELVALADQLSAVALLCESWGGLAIAATFSPSDLTEFRGLRHPILALNRPVVPATLNFTQAFVLTGPNTGGKTVLLKGAGLGVAMAWTGLPIPAEAVVLPATLKGLYADIGDDQSLENNLSTFSGHLLVLKQMLTSARPGDLVLIDEIATGTSPEEGQPLAQAVIEELLNKGVKTFVTTHYGGLKQFAMIDDRCRIASMAFDSKSKTPTFEILLDIPGESSAFEIAHQMGFPEVITDRARILRGEVSKDMAVAIERLEEARKKYSQRLFDVAAAEALAREREQRAAEKIAEYEARQREGLSQEARDILKNFSGLREELSQLVKKASAADLSAGAGNLFVKISEASDQVRSVVESVGKFDPQAAPLKDEELAAQTFVDVEGFGIGQIVEAPKDLSRGLKTQVSVQLGDMQMLVARSKLHKPAPDQVRSFVAHRAANLAARDRKLGQAPKSGAMSGSLVCDVRGKTLDEAMRRVENMLNGLSRDENAIVTIIHGHGSDRLKDGIRGYIQKERGDLVFRPGTWPGEGGDGVTVVERTKG